MSTTTGQQNHSSPHPVGNGMDCIGGSIQARLTAIMTSMIHTGTTVTDLGATNAMNELVAQMTASKAVATQMITSASQQCSELSSQAAGSLGSAGATGVCLVGQQMAASDTFGSGANSKADVLSDKLAQQQKLDSMANDRMTAGDTVGSAAVGLDDDDVSDTSSVGSDDTEADDSPIGQAIEARRQALVNDGGSNPYADAEGHDEVVERFPGSDKPAYCQSKTTPGNTTSLDKEAIDKMSLEKDEDGESELSKFRTKLAGNIKSTSEELNAVRSQINGYRTIGSELSQIFGQTAQGTATLVQKQYVTGKGHADAAGQVAQAAASAAQTGLSAAQQVQSTGAKSIEDAANAISAAIRSAQAA